MAFDDIAGRVALVTGAARGIGRATAAALLERGARVALTDVDASLVNITAGTLDPRRTRTRAYGLDVRDADAFDEVVRQTEHDLGPIDILVNNAGIMPLGRFADMDAEALRLQFDINVFGVMNGMRSVLPKMRPRKRGHIVNIASSAGVVGIPYAAAYSATKHAVVGLTEAVRREEVEHGIDLSYILPTPVNTELISGSTRMRWPPVQSTDDVAMAILYAIRTGQVDVFVPRSARLGKFLQAVAPRSVYERVGRLLKMDRLFGEVDEVARASYRRRVFTKDRSPTA